MGDEWESFREMNGNPMDGSCKIRLSPGYHQLIDGKHPMILLGLKYHPFGGARFRNHPQYIMKLGSSPRLKN